MTDGDGVKGLLAEGIGVRYGGVVANEEVGLAVAPGAIVGLVGPNGAGKTTFVDAVTGYTRYQGTVSLDGQPLDGLAPHLRSRAGLSRTWQSGELFGGMSVAENVAVGLADGGFRSIVRDVLGRRRGGAEGRVRDVIKLVGLDAHPDVLCRDLPLGHQKLVGVARALARQCRVVLLDEPAAGLDRDESADLVVRLQEIAAGGPGVLLIDHDMSVVLNACHTIHVMEFGRLIASGTPEQVRRDPDVVRAYLGHGSGEGASR